MHRDTVSSWIDNFEHLGVDGLRDKPRSGGPPKLNEQEKEVAKELLKTHSNAPSMVLALLSEKTGKTIKPFQLKTDCERGRPACASHADRARRSPKKPWLLLTMRPSTQVRRFRKGCPSGKRRAWSSIFYPDTHPNSTSSKSCGVLSSIGGCPFQPT